MRPCIHQIKSQIFQSWFRKPHQSMQIGLSTHPLLCHDHKVLNGVFLFVFYSLFLGTIRCQSPKAFTSNAHHGQYFETLFPRSSLDSIPQISFLHVSKCWQLFLPFFRRENGIAFQLVFLSQFYQDRIDKNRIHLRCTMWHFEICIH